MTDLNNMYELRSKAKELNIQSFGKTKEALQLEISKNINVENLGSKEIQDSPQGVNEARIDTPQLEARKRTEEIRKQRAKRGHIPGDRQARLAVEKLEPGFRYYWSNENRVKARQFMGYEVVEDENPRPVSGPLQAVLMKIPQEIFDEDKSAIQNRISDQVQAIQEYGSHDPSQGVRIGVDTYHKDIQITNELKI